MNRREMLAGSAGLSFAFALGPMLVDGAGALAQTAGRLNAYVTIATDGAITIMTPAPEMGQGVNTVLPLIIAEELDADWAKVKVQQAPVDAVYNHPIFKQQYQVASLTTRGYWMPLRTAGAQARRVLLDAAAERWGVPAAELTTEPSTVVHAASGRKLSYGEIASFAKAPAQLPEIKPDQLKPVKQFRLLGNDVPRIDMLDKSSRPADVCERRAGAGHAVRHGRARAGARLRPGLVQRRRDQEAARHRRRGRARLRRRHRRQHGRAGVRRAPRS